MQDYNRPYMCYIIALISGGNIGTGTVISSWNRAICTALQRIMFQSHVHTIREEKRKYATEELLNQHSDRLSENDLPYDYVEKHKK